MIAIVNVSENPQPDGMHHYEIRINRKVICDFWHHREQPLSVCLNRAMKAVKAKEKALREISK